MMKNYILGLAALAFASGAFAQAKVTFKWSTPGSVVLVKDSPRNTPEQLSADQTQYVFEGEGSFYVMTPYGYILKSVKAEGESRSQNTSIPTFGNYSSSCSLFISDSDNNKTYIIDSEKVANDLSLSVNVENGADYLSASLSAKWTDADGVRFGYQVPVTLKDGNNDVPFSSKYTKDLNISLISSPMAKNIYSLTRNGEKQNGGYWSTFSLTNITPEDKVIVRVFENEAPVSENCILTVSLPEPIKDCVESIFDWGKSKFVTLTDNKLEVVKGSDVQVNLNEDYDFTKFTLNDKDITDKYKPDNNSIRFTVNEDATFYAEGSAKVYEDVEFTAYVMNPEGVRITKGVYGSEGEALNIEEGTPITSNIELPASMITSKDGTVTKLSGATMTPENTRIFKIKVNGKKPTLYFSPADGYFVKAVWDEKIEESLSYVTYIDGQKTFYLAAQKINESATATVIKNGEDRVAFQPSTAYSAMWGNSTKTFTLTSGEQTIKFDPEYHAPFSLHSLAASDKFEVYLDGLMLNPDDNGVYSIDFHTEAAAAVNGQSELTIFADGKTTGKHGSVKITTEDGKTAECYYSPLRIKAPATSFSMLPGTPVTICPKGENLYMTMGSEIIYGYDNDVLVNKLVNGEYTFTVEPQKIYTFNVSEDFNVPDPSGVEEIGAADGDAGEIYNLQGISLGKDLKVLPAGIYIRNGKKILKK